MFITNSVDFLYLQLQSVPAEKLEDCEFSEVKNKESLHFLFFGVSAKIFNYLPKCDAKIHIYENNLQKIKAVQESISLQSFESICWITSFSEMEKLAFEIAFRECSCFYLLEKEKVFRHFLLLIENTKISIARQDFAIKNHRGSFERFLKQHYQINKKSLGNFSISIVGAGPSLRDSIDEIKAQVASKFIFSSLRGALFLLQNGIIPDFIGVLDSVEELNVPRQLQSVPCFYTYQANPKQINLFDHPILVNNIDANPLEQFIVNQFLQPSIEVEAGHTVASFLFSIALSFFAKSITLYGVDLAYSEKGKYFDSKELPQEKLQEFIGSNGEKYLTKQDFILSKYWFEYQIKKYPDVQFFNRSQGLSLDGFNQNYLIDQKSKKKLVELELSEPLNLKKITFLKIKLEQLLSFPPVIGEISELLFYSDLQDLDLLSFLEKMVDPLITCGYLNPEKKISFFGDLLNLVLNDLRSFVKI